MVVLAIDSEDEVVTASTPTLLVIIYIYLNTTDSLAIQYIRCIQYKFCLFVDWRLIIFNITINSIFQINEFLVE